MCVHTPDSYPYFFLPLCQELNLSFGEITGEAALLVAQSVEGKATLEKLDLNGTCWIRT